MKTWIQNHLTEIILILAFLALVFVIAAVFQHTAPAAAGAEPSTLHPQISTLLSALEQVESAGNPDAIGDHGRSLGPLQITRPYWLDAGMPGHYDQVRDPRYARLTVIRYWRRYCPQALACADLQTLARTHNGGPNGPRKRATLNYWRRVQAAMHR